MTIKVLIVILAETRASELTYELFKKNVLDRLDADLALCIGDNVREVQNGYYSSAKYLWTYKEPDDWALAFDEYAQGRNWRRLLELREQWLGGVRHPKFEQPGSAGILIFFREFLRRKIEELGIVETYDWIIITRSDFMWPLPYPCIELFSPHFIYFPDGERYGGFTDRHVMVPKMHLQKFLDVARDVFDEPDALFSRMQALSRPYWNLEAFIQFRVGELGLRNKVRFFPYLMYSVRSAANATRWFTGNYNHEHRCFIKYPSELDSVRLLQSLLTSDKDWRFFIGRRRFLNWKMYIFALLRALSERRYISIRMRGILKRFVIYLIQPN